MENRDEPSGKTSEEVAKLLQDLEIIGNKFLKVND